MAPGGTTPTLPALLLAPRVEAAIAHIGSPRVTGTQVRAFLALARGGSYTVAAEATGLAPASLHRAVADLSLALGTRLDATQARALVAPCDPAFFSRVARCGHRGGQHSHAELAGPLRDGEIDLMLGALRYPAAVEDLVQEQVFIDRPQVIVRAGHPLAATGRPTGAALAAHDWILPTRDTPLRR